MDVAQTERREGEEGGFDGGRECGERDAERAGQDVQDHDCEAWHAEVTEGVEEDDCGLLSVERGYRGICRWEDGVGDDQVE